MSLRVVAKDVTLCGYSVPAEKRVVIAPHPIQMDPSLVEDVDKFIPERWSEEEVAKRKGTRKELIDHILCKRPFSFGARMCLGSRVAELEIKAFLAHLVTNVSLLFPIFSWWL